MIVYSVTVSLEEAIEEEWLTWMKEVHIPEVMDTGYFKEHRIHKLLEPIMEPDRVSYNIWYLCPSLEKLEEYREGLAPGLQKKHLDRYGQQCIAFRTVLEMI